MGYLSGLSIHPSHAHAALPHCYHARVLSRGEPRPALGCQEFCWSAPVSRTSVYSYVSTCIGPRVFAHALKQRACATRHTPGHRVSERDIRRRAFGANCFDFSQPFFFIRTLFPTYIFFHAEKIKATRARIVTPVDELS